MDTKMKVPEWIAWKHPGTGWVLEHPDGEVTEAELLEVIARCNAAPKLVEALKREMGWAQHNGDIRAIERIQAILKETGAEK